MKCHMGPKHQKYGVPHMHINSATRQTILAMVMASATGLTNAGLIDGRQLIGKWDFSNGNTLDITGKSNGEIVGKVEIGTFGGREAAGFLRGKSKDYIKFEDQDAYQLADGVLAIDFMQTGRWNTKEALFSKDARGYVDGGHLTVHLLRGQSSHEGSIQVRLQSKNGSFYVNSGMLNLGQWYRMEFGFGSNGMQLAVDGVVVDTNNYTGGLIGNFEDFSLGASRWASRSGEWNRMKYGYSGYISSVGLYGATIPAPGALALLLTGGLVCTRRHRSTR